MIRGLVPKRDLSSKPKSLIQSKDFSQMKKLLTYKAPNKIQIVREFIHNILQFLLCINPLLVNKEYLNFHITNKTNTP